jgi:hypothetical protein
LHAVICIAAEQDLILGAVFLDAFACVDAVADGGVLESFLRADPA